jgi:hypothetical protein
VSKSPSSPLDKLRSILVQAGIVIILGGVAAAAWIWHNDDDSEPAAPAGMLAPLDSRKQVRDVEIYYGRLGLLMEKAKDRFQGRALAKFIGLACLGTGGGLFLVAARLREK